MYVEERLYYSIYIQPVIRYSKEETDGRECVITYYQ